MHSSIRMRIQERASRRCFASSRAAIAACRDTAGKPSRDSSSVFRLPDSRRGRRVGHPVGLFICPRFFSRTIAVPFLHREGAGRYSPSWELNPLVASPKNPARSLRGFPPWAPKSYAEFFRAIGRLQSRTLWTVHAMEDRSLQKRNRWREAQCHPPVGPLYANT